MANKKPDLALGLRRTPAGWQVVQYKIQDGKILSQQATEPDNKSLAQEQLQQQMVSLFILGDE